MFLDKRDEKGQLLSFKAFSLSEEIAEKGVQKFTNSLIFKELKNIFPENLTILLFKKLIFEMVFKTSCNILISKSNNEKIINTDFDLINLLKEKKDLSNFIFSKKKEKIFNLENIKKDIRNRIWLNYSKICFVRNLINLFFPLNKDKKKGIKIAVNFLDGINLRNSSDFFWYDQDILSNRVLTYFESDSRITKFNKDKKKIISKLRSLNIDCKYLYSFNNFEKNEKLDNLRAKIENLKVVEEENFFKINTLIFISKIQYTLNFFKNNNIKIHQNTEGSGTSNILRQIAIRLSGGCSFGRTRSYPSNIKGDFIGFAPNDIFFAWGKESAKRIAKTDNCINHIIITGDHYPTISSEKNQIMIKKIEKLKKNKINFFILVLDSLYSDNNNSKVPYQCVNTKKMENFLEKILDFQKNNPDVGLIIKSKKKDILKNLNKTFEKIKKLEKEHKCIFLNNSDDLASHYSKFADFTLSCSTHIQGALFHCLINSEKFRGIMYDDSNLSIVEKEIYKLGKDKVIFNDVEKMLNELEKYKNRLNYIPDLGKWNPEQHDPFRDGLGSKRIGQFLNNLIYFYEKGLNTKKAINKTINEYTKVYNSDKIYEKK